MLVGIIIAFGLIVVFTGCLMIARPDVVFAPLSSIIDRPAVQLAAVLIRLLLGYLLIAQSGVSKFPLAMEIIGWIAVIAAIVLALMGRENFKRLMHWALSLFKPLGRTSGVVVVAFGAFLVYGFS